MRNASGRNMLALAAIAVFAAAVDAQAEEGKVDVRTEVVLASNESDVVDPPRLSKLQAELSKMGVRFSSFKRLSESNVTLTSSKAAEVKLPDGRAASLKLVELKSGVATVNVVVPSRTAGKTLMDAKYQVGRSPVTIGPIDHERGKLILILSPPSEAKPRVLRPLKTRPVVHPARAVQTY